MVKGPLDVPWAMVRGYGFREGGGVLPYPTPQITEILSDPICERAGAHSPPASRQEPPFPHVTRVSRCLSFPCQNSHS